METILVNVEAHVATITINRPKALNALSTQVLTELNTALDEVNENKDVQALKVEVKRILIELGHEELVH